MAVCAGGHLRGRTPGIPPRHTPIPSWLSFLFRDHCTLRARIFRGKPFRPPSPVYSRVGVVLPAVRLSLNPARLPCLVPDADIHPGGDGRRGTSDPYVLFETDGADSKSTETVWNDLNPRFTRTLEFNFDPDGEVGGWDLARREFWCFPVLRPYPPPPLPDQ